MLRNKRTMAAASKKTIEEHPRNGHLGNTFVLRNNKEYITQVSEKIEDRVKINLSQQLSRTESCILGVLPKLDEFLLNPQIRTLSGTVPGTCRKNDVESQTPTEGGSQNDSHPEVEFFACRSSNPVN